MPAAGRLGDPYRLPHTRPSRTAETVGTKSIIGIDLAVSRFGYDFPVLVPALVFRKRSSFTVVDDKKKIGQPDRNLISFKEKYEFDYAAKQLQKQVPDTTKQEARDALTRAARQVSPSEGREKIMRAARKILKD